MISYSVIAALLLHASVFGQSFVVSSKKFDCRTSFFTSTKTYAWAPDEDSLGTHSRYLNDINLKIDIEQSVNAQLQVLGYVANNSHPHILVKYDVLKAPSRLQGSNQFNRNAIGNDTVTVNYNVDPGTLLITFVDPQTQKPLWQGFASGLIDSQAPKKNTVMVREAVRLVMQEYTHMINGSSAQ